MAALARVAAAAALLLASAAQADTVTRWRSYIAEASARFGVPARWIEAVMRAESGGHLTLAGRPITSPAGAMGLMQLMPATWDELRRALQLGDDPHDAHDNIVAGTAYLRRMYDRFGYPGLFAAYNAGPRRYTASLTSGTSLPRETRAYLAALDGNRAIASGPAAPASEGLFVVRHEPGDAARQAVQVAKHGTVFVTLSHDR